MKPCRFRVGPALRAGRGLGRVFEPTARPGAKPRPARSASPTARAAVTALALACASTATAYDTLGPTWPSGSIPLRLQLDATATARTFPLTDGATSWDSIAEAALNDWNARLARSRFTSTSATTIASRGGDGVNSVLFASDIYGMPFGDALAVTLVQPLDVVHVRTVEADVLVNSRNQWNSYRGSIRTNPVDLRRVLLHELGHVLGLGHPDEATPAQFVPAIMNSRVGNTESAQSDDLAGVEFLYNTPFTRPTITTHPANRTVLAAGSTSLDVAVNGETRVVEDQFHSYVWYFRAPGANRYEPLFTLKTLGTLEFNLAQLADAGSYYFKAVTPDHSDETVPVTLTVDPITSTPATALANLSTRGRAGSGGDSMIVGFRVEGPRAKTVLLRAIGPTLATFGLAGTLGDPQLVLRNSNQITVATSTPVWDQSANVADIRAAAARAGAFPLPAGSRDAVVLVTLPPGNYTAQTTSPLGNRGLVTVEAYDADATPDPASRLTNLSTRGFVGTEAEVMIAGFVVRGPGPRNYLIRVAGDTLQSFGVSGTLDDPFLKLFRGDGVQLREFDDWDSPAALQPTLRSTFTQVGAFAFNDRQEPAMIVTLPPGNYTAHVSGLDNEGSTNPRGVALIELYELP